MTELSIAYATRPLFENGTLHLEIRCQRPSEHIQPFTVVRRMEHGKCSFHRILEIVSVDDDQRRAVVRVGNP